MNLYKTCDPQDGACFGSRQSFEQYRKSTTIGDAIYQISVVVSDKKTLGLVVSDKKIFLSYHFQNPFFAHVT